MSDCVASIVASLPLSLRYVTNRPGRVGAQRWYWQRRGHALKRLSDIEGYRIAEARALNEAADQGLLPVKEPRPDTRRAAIVYQRRLSDELDAGFLRAKRRAQMRDLPFSITRADLTAIIERQDGRCAVTGIEFDLSPFKGAGGTYMAPYRPSIDRRDASLGYTPENCRIVCFAVNVALGEWGDEVFLRIAQAALSRQFSRASSNGFQGAFR